MKELEKTLKALANRRRLAIVKHVKSNKEASVGEIACAIHLSFKSTSRHLSVLVNAEILDREQRSLQVFYRLASDQKSVVRYIFTIL